MSHSSFLLQKLELYKLSNYSAINQWNDGEHEPDWQENTWVHTKLRQTTGVAWHISPCKADMSCWEFWTLTPLVPINVAPETHSQEGLSAVATD